MHSVAVFTSGGNLVLNSKVMLLLEGFSKDTQMTDNSKLPEDPVIESCSYTKYPKKGKGKKSRNRRF